MANVVKKHSISSELAQKMVDQAVAKATELGVTENVAILDDGGNLKAFSRMDGTPIPTKDVHTALLERTDHATNCPYKGDCAYYSIPLGGERSVDAVWTY